MVILELIRETKLRPPAADSFFGSGGRAHLLDQKPGGQSRGPKIYYGLGPLRPILLTVTW